MCSVSLTKGGHTVTKQDDVTFKVEVTMRHLGGATQDAETLLDAFAAAIGRDNTARHPLVIELIDFDDETNPSRYEVGLVDEA
jgi:hypothetical protein